MGCTHSTPPPTISRNNTVPRVAKQNESSPAHTSQQQPTTDNEDNNSETDSLGSLNKSMGSALRLKKNMKQLVWVNDDLNLKAHLAKVNGIAELTKKYELIGPVLGEGMTGTVSLCKSKPEGVVYALKSLNVSKLDDSQLNELRAEVSLLKHLDSPCIISLREVFESESTICIILEYLQGGDLSQRRFTNELQVADAMYQVLKGVAHCHQKHICHRDLKLENVMFVRPDSDRIRIIDFGLSTRFGNVGPSFRNTNAKDNDTPRVMKSLCGTVFYFAPEMLVDRCYSEKADIWAVGVMSHMLLCGSPPFQGTTEQETVDKIKHSTCVAFDSPLWQTLSPQAKDFCSKLLCFDATQRLSAREALQHPFLLQIAKANWEKLQNEDAMLLQAVRESILRFAAYPVLKQAALMIVVHRCDSRTTEKLQELFLALDRSGFGMLSLEDLCEFLCVDEAFCSREQCKVVFDKINQDKSSYIDCMEFMSSAIESQMVCTDDFWKVAFGHLDVDNSGGISVEDVLDLLGAGFTESDVTQIMHTACDGEGTTLGQEKFLELMDQSKSPTPPIFNSSRSASMVLN